MENHTPTPFLNNFSSSIINLSELSSSCVKFFCASQNSPFGQHVDFVSVKSSFSICSPFQFKHVHHHNISISRLQVIFLNKRLCGTAPSFSFCNNYNCNRQLTISTEQSSITQLKPHVLCITFPFTAYIRSGKHCFRRFNQARLWYTFIITFYCLISESNSPCNALLYPLLYNYCHWWAVREIWQSIASPSCFHDAWW